MRKLVLALAAILLLAAAPPAADWSKTVVRKPDGAFVIGNPKAPKTLVEYASYTCSHCAEFSVESTPELEQQIAAGKVRLEFRHAVRDPLDFTAALLARCAGPTKFLAATKAFYASQFDWSSRSQAYLKADKKALAAATPDQARLMVARNGGLMAVVAPLGVTDAKGAACLLNKAEQQAVLAQSNDAWDRKKIPGTPYFVINGAPAGTNLWPEMREALGKP
ncbi:thioredoxin domain-containing protein [Erythrobacter sp. NE805]|uniref:thioredoxin domain-containing protein n=1 Tax=Erythrobacter sp. NE805 TaxID=3389875 RepID=UPI00396B33E7